MGTFESDRIWGLVVFLALLCAGAAYNAFDAFRFREWRRLFIWLALAPVFAVGSLVTLHFAAPISIGNPWGGVSLGPGWECSAAPPGARVCFKDVPPALDRPKTAPTGPNK